VFALKSRERQDKLNNPNMLTFREIMTNGLFESDIRVVLKKPDFFFGDTITEDDRILYDGDYKWLRQIGDKRYFSSQHGKDVPLSLSSAHVGTPRNGVGPFSVYFQRVLR